MSRRGIFRWEVDDDEYCCDRYDYGDSLKVSPHRCTIVMSKRDNSSPESHQCFVINLAAAVLWIKLLREPSITEVMTLAAQLLDDLAESAGIAEDELGPHHELMTKANVTHTA